METTALDPYQYLEDGSDPRTVAWTVAENARSRAALDAIPGRARLVRSFGELLETGTLGVAHARGGREFYVARRGRQDQAVLYVREGGVDRLLLDPTALDPSGLTALDWWHPSPQGTYVAYGLSRNGDERSTLYLLDVAHGSKFGETIPYTRYCALAWLPDERGFYYTRYAAGADYEQRLYRHELGAAWQDDPLVFGQGRAREDILSPQVSANGRWLVVSALRGWVSNELFLADLHGKDPRAFVPIVTGRDALYDVAISGDKLIVRSNEHAPRYRCLEVDLTDPAPERWRELVPEHAEAKLEAVGVARGGLLLSYLHDVVSVLHYRLDDGTTTLNPANADFGGMQLGPSVVALSAHEDSSDAYALSVGFLQGPAVSRLRFGSDGLEVELWDAIDGPFDPEDYTIEQHWYHSKDGTHVPMFVLAHAATKLDGSAPAVLYGYGGFNIAMTPSFQPAILPWLDSGGIYAIANLRGGGEFGEAWHRAGMRDQKQNVFDDFVAAAEYLGSSRLADPARIGILGGSNGGLLVAAALVQRPELFAAAVCAVPLCDMLQYHRFLIARLWISEYGDPDEPADASFLRAYSPYHNLRENIAYPATFLVTAESDTRVDPMHARKFGAKLQAATNGEDPILVYIEAQAGHGIGKPRAKQIEELADRWAFFGRYLTR